MSVLIDSSARVLVQNITGREGSFHTQQMLAYGTNVVAGVALWHGGESVGDVPVFNTVREAVAHTNPNVSAVFVPPAPAPDAIIEAVNNGIGLVVCITEGIPTLDMIKVRAQVRRQGSRLIGPNCPGLITPGQCKVGIMTGKVFMPGPVGIVSRSGTLTYEIAAELARIGVGQSTCIGIGGDPIIGSSFMDILTLFERDPDTKAIGLIGEIGGTGEENAAEFIASSVTKPVVAFIAGKTAPPEKRMGHAGAVISRGRGSAAGKAKALEEAGVVVANTTEDMAAAIAAALPA
jgi:succinyl-CoA synthetase alpha subunit